MGKMIEKIKEIKYSDKRELAKTQRILSVEPKISFGATS